MPPGDLEHIVSRLRSDDKSILHELFQENYLPVCKTIHRFIRDKNLVEDLAQEVFLRFWEKRAQLQITSSVPAYLHRMAVNEALGYLRRNKRFDDDGLEGNIPDGIDNSAEEQYLHTELEESVVQAINDLPPRCRAVFQLSRYEELTYQEIADKLDISIKTVENQMGKALKILRERLRSYLNLFF